MPSANNISRAGEDFICIYSLYSILINVYFLENSNEAHEGMSFLAAFKIYNADNENYT